ncbi:unnamed protein product [Musa acuminata subsp. burmannicoides]
MSSPELFSVVVDEEAPHHHFHDACFLCKKLIAGNEDIFMYRGGTQFCSRECRREQMDMDEALEKDRVASYSASPSASSTQQAFSAKRKPLDHGFQLCEENRFGTDAAVVAIS